MPFPRPTQPLPAWCTGVLLSLTLAGCGGPPNEADVRAALERQARTEVNAAGTLFGTAGASVAQSIAPTIQRVTVRQCQADGRVGDATAYRCQIDLTRTRLGITTEGPTETRLVTDAEGWRVVDAP